MECPDDPESCPSPPSPKEAFAAVRARKKAARANLLAQAKEKAAEAQLDAITLDHGVKCLLLLNNILAAHTSGQVTRFKELSRTLTEAFGLSIEAITPWLELFPQQVQQDDIEQGVSRHGCETHKNCST